MAIDTKEDAETALIQLGLAIDALASAPVSAILAAEVADLDGNCLNAEEVLKQIERCLMDVRWNWRRLQAETTVTVQSVERV